MKYLFCIQQISHLSPGIMSWWLQEKVLVIQDECSELLSRLRIHFWTRRQQAHGRYWEFRREVRKREELVLSLRECCLIIATHTKSPSATLLFSPQRKSYQLSFVFQTANLEFSSLPFLGWSILPSPDFLWDHKGWVQRVMYLWCTPASLMSEVTEQNTKYCKICPQN